MGSTRHFGDELATVCEQDVPSTGPVTAIPFELFVSHVIDSPNALPDAYFMALHGDQLAWIEFEKGLG